MYEVRVALLDDWPAIKAAWEEFSNSKQAKKKIDGNVDMLAQMFLQSLTTPVIKLFVLFDGIKCKAVSIVQEVYETTSSDRGLTLIQQPYGFIRAVFGLSGVPRAEMLKLDSLMVEWGIFRKHTKIVGNCRVDFPVRAARAYGYEQMAIVMGKRI